MCRLLDLGIIFEQKVLFNFSLSFQIKCKMQKMLQKSAEIHILEHLKMLLFALPSFESWFKALPYLLVPIKPIFKAS